MAQAVFDDHPIEQYLRESGEVPELMPGGTVEFSREPSHDPYNTSILCQWLLQLVRPLRNTALHVLSSTGLRNHSAESEFAEKFKYIVISSPLLSSSLASSSPNRAPTPTTPGHYEHNAPQSEASTSLASTTSADSSTSLLAFPLACLIPVALAQGYYISSIVLFAVVKVWSDQGLSLPAALTSGYGNESWSMTLESLEALVSANNTWDIVVSEALGLVDSQERNSFHPSSSSPQSPSLRIALSSSLHTTQTQCDNVRQLLSTLTSTVALSQLSEMYAPPSPSPMHTAFPSRSTRSRPTSLAVPPLHRSSSYQPLLHAADDTTPRARTSSAPLAFPADKRSTWNGSYMSLAGIAPRRQKRRPNLSTFNPPDCPKSPTNLNAKGSSSVPPTPSPPLTVRLPSVEDASGHDADVEEPFGLAALSLRRKRRSSRALLFDGGPSPRAPPSVPSSPYGSPQSSSFGGSRFTTFSAAASPSRHSPANSSSRHSPLSLSNLHLALHGALAAKRFACAHLLALRFRDPQRADSADDEDEAYWEDVRSIIALLTSALEDASARLGEALGDATRTTEAEEESSVPASPEPEQKQERIPLPPQSFAPVPSHLSRFAAHVDAISTALDDAQEHLQASVASLRDSTTEAAAVEASLESYERLRRELGLALRECERGRGTLLELVKQNSPNPAEEEGDEDLPARHSQQFSSGESEKTLFNLDEQLEVKDVREHESDTAAVHDLDDASAHLIMVTTSQHLPPPGIEQVFESLSAAPAPFSRERSKLTREERIRLAKARRESGSVTPFAAVEDEQQPRQAREGWGPGGEVVQELKDVIWKVGEQRRKMVEQSSQ